MKTDTIADVCLILEGTYPYVTGGVSSWAYELIKTQSHLTFHLVSITPPGAKLVPRYEIPENVIGLENITLQHVRPSQVSLRRQYRKRLFQALEKPLQQLQTNASSKSLRQLNRLLKIKDNRLGASTLMNSEEAFQCIVNLYNNGMQSTSFLDFFWSWRALFSGLLSILLTPVPRARCYHSLCTGYAGLYLAYISITRHVPCILTEHGIYTNERRIEIGSADWLSDQKSMNLTLDKEKEERNLRDLWIDSFTGFSRLCYSCCQRIITLYEGNKELQEADGADPQRLEVIPNGIDYEKFSAVLPESKEAPTIALIGRIVPIKDIKTFIRAVSRIHQNIPELKALLMGPMDEDEDYFESCREMISHLQLNDVIEFTGKVNIVDYLPRVDVLVLTSISEAQPLVILECGAAGIPSVTTDVGACREMIYGRSDEYPNLGQAGEVCSLSAPAEIARAVIKLISDRDFYQSCSTAIKERVKTYYNKKDQHQAYRDIYATFCKTD